MFEFKRFPMLDADDGLNIGGTGAEEPNRSLKKAQKNRKSPNRSKTTAIPLLQSYEEGQRKPKDE